MPWLHGDVEASPEREMFRNSITLFVEESKIHSSVTDWAARIEPLTMVK